MNPLQTLLDVLRPGGAPIAAAEADAELRALGLVLAPGDAEIVRALAVAGPLLLDVLAATVSLPPKALAARIAALVAAGHLVRHAPRVSLAPRWQGLFGEMARLPEPPLSAPGVSWRDALDALSRGPASPSAHELPSHLAAAMGWAPNERAGSGLPARLAALDEPTRALLSWLAPRLAEPALTPLLRFGVERVRVAALAATGEGPDEMAALEASLFLWLGDLADVLTPALLQAQADRREELLRRWCWFLGVAVPQETLPVSLARLVRLDYRRIRADLEAAAVEQEAQAVQKQLLDEERARRKAAAESYASGRRE